MSRSTERVGIYLDNAWNFYKRGVEELVKGIEFKATYMIRDSAEKLWNAIISASNALILHYLGIVSASHWERRKLLEKT